MRHDRIITALTLLVLLLFTGCQGKSSSAESAAEWQVRNQVETGVVVDPDSVEVLQTQEFETSTYVVLTYRRTWNDRNQTCIMLYETHLEIPRGWSAGSGGGACSDEDDVSAEEAAIRISGGTTFRSDQDKPDLSYVLGRVSDPKITQVNVMWQDGQPQQAQVVNGTFLSIRTGEVEIKYVVGLDETGQVLSSVNR